MGDGNAFDRNDGYSGQDYHRDAEAAEGRKAPSGTVAQRPTGAAPPAGAAEPPDAGRRASFDPHTGEVHGSGSGAGGGNAGEDHDSDSAAGERAPPTGAEGRQP